jgi:hypothetical protein
MTEYQELINAAHAVGNSLAVPLIDLGRLVDWMRQ